MPFLRERIGNSQRCLEKSGKEGILYLSKSVEDYIKNFYYDTALTTGIGALKALLETTSIDHLFYASDSNYVSID